MKTNVVLQSQDRELFGVIIKQETKTGFLSITELANAYDKARWQYGWSSKHLPTLMQSHTMTERIYYILKERDLIKVSFDTFMEMVDREGIAKVLKGLGVWRTTGKGSNRVVMCDPYIWVAIAVEMNPMLYAKVMMFITDSLIFDRIEAGNEFKPMNKAISTIVTNPDYKKYATAINEKVFGFHQTGMRNLATAKQLKDITKIEQFVKQGIELGLITTDDQIVNSIKNITI